MGESLRPIVSRWAVILAYAVSWAYVTVDVFARTMVELTSGRKPASHALRVMTFFSLFHSVVTMLIPAALIHSVVHHSQHVLQHAASLMPRLLSLWAPTAIGIAVIPLLPIFDAPMEKVLDHGFDLVWPVAPQQAVAAPKWPHVSCASEEG